MHLAVSYGADQLSGQSRCDPGSEPTCHRSRLCVCRPHLLLLRCTHAVGERSIARRERSEGTPLDRALALHGVSGYSGSHLGSTLKPGGAVLTLGVFRRSRSVACIRADASPSEVLARAIVPPNSEGVNLAPEHDARPHPVKRWEKSRVNAHCRNATAYQDPLWPFKNHDGKRRGCPVAANIDVGYELRRA